MTFRRLTMIASAALAAPLLLGMPAMAASDGPTFTKRAAPDAKLKQKAGYWMECRYTGSGEVCEYVYMGVKGNTKFQRLKVSDSKLQKRGDYWLECRYTGSGQVCEYVYMRVRKPAN